MYNKPGLIHYRTAQAASWIVSTFVFKRKILRNEIKNKKGPFVVIANHQAALDFVNLIGTTSQPMSFVISNSFYSTLPIKGFMKKMGVIPKQQFQTTLTDMRTMKAVIEQGEVLVIYPAGLMCEDGLSTPIPAATYRFLKWLKADVYMAKSFGTYFVMPKWGKGMRPGRTYLDIYKLFSKEELETMDISEVKARADKELLFDAYREQESVEEMHCGTKSIEGLENVLYKCPNCGKEFSVKVKNKNIIYCEACGFEQVSDKCGFLRNEKGVGREIRYVSDWSRYIYNDLKEKVRAGIETELSTQVKIHMIDPEKDKFAEVGEGSVTLSSAGFRIKGKINGEGTEINVSIKNVPTLPFKPGRHFEVQDGQTIYRCLPEDGRQTMKFINMVKIFCELDAEETAARKAVKQKTQLEGLR